MRITKAQLVALVQHGLCFECRENYNGAMVVVSNHILCANCHSQTL